MSKESDARGIRAKIKATLEEVQETIARAHAVVDQARQLLRAQRLRSRGLNTTEIATVLGVSPRTVFRYLAEKDPRGLRAPVSREAR